MLPHCHTAAPSVKGPAAYSLKSVVTLLAGHWHSTRKIQLKTWRLPLAGY